jgi:cytochrome c oxidase subunit IV
MAAEPVESAFHDAGAGAHVGHVVPLGVLAATLTALLVLTFVTVAVSWIDLGALNLWVALLIASGKATLVILYFMHLRYEKPFNAVVLICALLFVVLFCSLTLMDSFGYQANVEDFRAASPGNYAPDLQNP